jgi:hypothetical protein
MPADRDEFDAIPEDSILDQALAAYTSAEPDPSLRARIMARAAATAPRPRRVLWPAAAALSAATLLVAFLLHPTSPTPKQEQPAAPIASAPPPAIATSPSINAVPRHNAKFTRHSEPRALPAIARNRTFPSPTPLTAEENDMLRLAFEHPQQARQALAAAAPGLIENAPLSINPIRIAALSEPQSPQSMQ